MAIFFFVVGLEIKRGLVHGELSSHPKGGDAGHGSLRRHGRAGADLRDDQRGRQRSVGLGIPMATDIALAIGVLSLLGARIVPSLRVYLLALAIVDDLGARSFIIALFYSGDIDMTTLAVAALLVAAVAGARLIGIHVIMVYVVLGIGLWLALHESGVHSTLTGVVLGLMTPTAPFRSRELIDADELADVSTVEAAHHTAVVARQSVSVVEWLEHLLHPWSGFVIVPLFALANAGVPVTSEALSTGRVVTDHLRRRARARRWQAARHRRVHVARERASTSPSCRQRPPGRPSSVPARSPASASPCRCSSPASPSTTRSCRTRRRSASSPPRRSPPCSAR